MKLVYTKPVRNRIGELRDYLTTNVSPEQAEKVISYLLDKADELLDHPLRGVPEASLAKLNMGHRCLIAGRYKIVYYVKDEEIHITDFFDTKQHPSRMRG